MHICYLCDEYPPAPHGGLGSFVQTISRELVKRGHQVTVVGFYEVHKRQQREDQGVRIIQLPRSNMRFANIWINRYALAKELSFLHQIGPLDLVEGSELSFAFLPKLRGVGYIIRLHGGHHFFSIELGKKPRVGRGWYEKLSFRNADFFCAVSKHVASRTRVWLHMRRPPAIIPNPVDTELFSPDQKDESDGLIAFIGTVCEKKGVRHLVQAMPLILDAHPTAQLLVIGRDQFDKELGKSFTEHLKQTLDSEVRSHATFLGAVDHDKLPALLNKVSLCVYPSHMEAMPVAWLEGMAMGKAVVASKTGPGPELIDDGKNGLLCNPHDPKSIADKVNYALSDSNLRNRLGLAARSKVESEFSIEVLAKRNLDFYEDCLNK